MDTNRKKAKCSPGIQVQDYNKLPIRRTIHVKEVTHCAGKTAIRQVKYEEVYDAGGSRYLQNKKEPTKKSNAVNNLSNRLANFNLESKDLSPVKDIPMDVDSSGNLSLNSSCEKIESPPTVKKRVIRQRIKKESVENKIEAKTVLYPSTKKSNYFRIVLVLLIVFFSLWVTSVLKLGDRFIFVNHELQLVNIKTSLRAVAYQTKAVATIIDTVEYLDNWRKPIKILPFIGSSGVGKTFTANILKRNFLSMLVHEINLDTLKNDIKQNKILDSINACCCNLIIIEDLNALDTSRVIDFVAKVPEGSIVLIIPIFNLENSFEGSEQIRNEFGRSELFYELVFFNVLEVKMIREWLQQELARRKVEKHRNHDLLKNLIDDKQVQKRGFKGINTKLLLALDNVY